MMAVHRRMLPGSLVNPVIGRAFTIGSNAEQRAERIEGVEAPVKAERELIEVGLKMLVRAQRTEGDIERISVFEQMHSPLEYRWAACWGTYDSGSVCGLGPTPEAAKADLIENYDRPASFDRDEGEILAAISQKYRGDHNIETLFVILTRVAFERLQLLEALKGLIEASGGMAPVGAESKYETAMERAEAVIAKVRV